MQAVKTLWRRIAKAMPTDWMKKQWTVTANCVSKKAIWELDLKTELSFSSPNEGAC